MKKNLVISIFNHNPDWIKFLNDDIKISGAKELIFTHQLLQ